MATIGTAGKNSIYVVRNNYPMPVSDAYFINYSGWFINYEVYGKICNLSSFTGVLVGNPTDTSPSGSGTVGDDIKDGSYIYVLAGTTIVGKFVISKPVFDEKRTCTINAIQSTGRIARKFMSRTVTSKKEYIDAGIDEVLFTTGGACVDDAGNPFVNEIEVDYGVTATVTFDGNNRVAALSSACSAFRREWNIEHGTNDSTPYSEGDRIRVLERIGSASSLYTFNLSGSSMNCFATTASEQSESAANHIIYNGTDSSGRRVRTEAFNATNDHKTYLSEALDGWVASDVTLDATTIPLKSGHGFGIFSALPGPAPNFYVRIGNEIIGCNISGNNLITCVRGNKIFEMVADTVAEPHYAGDDVILVKDVLQSVLNSVILVPTTTPANIPDGNFYVGSEIMTKVGIDPSSGKIMAQRVAPIAGWSNTYAHSAGAIVYPTSYTIDSPDTDDNSIYTNGLISVSLSDGSSRNIDSLDKKARLALEAKSDKPKAISLSLMSPIEDWATLNPSEKGVLGSMVTIANSGSYNISTGSYRIVEFRYSGPVPSLVLNLNEDSVRFFSASSEYDSFGEYSNQVGDSISSYSYGQDSLLNDYGTGVDSYAGTSNKQMPLFDVGVPSEAWSNILVDPEVYIPTTGLSKSTANAAASVGFVKGAVSTAVGTNYWTDNTTYLSPTSDRHVYPYDSSKNLGGASNRWNYVYTSSLSCEGSSASALVTIKNTGVGDDLNVGYSGSSYNFRVSKSYTGIYNGQLAFSNTNPYPYIIFYDNGGAITLNYGIRYSGTSLQYNDGSSGGWTNFGSSSGCLWVADGVNARPNFTYNHILPKSYTGFPTPYNVGQERSQDSWCDICAWRYLRLWDVTNSRECKVEMSGGYLKFWIETFSGGFINSLTVKSSGVDMVGSIVLKDDAGSPSYLAFNDMSVYIYRDGDNMKFKDNVCNGGAEVTLSQLFSGGGGSLIDHSHSGSGSGGSWLQPSVVTIGGSYSLPFYCWGTYINSSGSLFIKSTSNGIDMNAGGLPGSVGTNITGCNQVNCNEVYVADYVVIGPYSSGYPFYCWDTWVNASGDLHVSGTTTAVGTVYFTKALAASGSSSRLRLPVGSSMYG